ncbi:hypothetical protein K449DRAFT_433264 [Hypoxylon sp. EC38]|nr:hypothetical protein K449DRAFT_433264 [Hypoxylon sp. EC38]
MPWDELGHKILGQDIRGGPYFFRRRKVGVDSKKPEDVADRTGYPINKMLLYGWLERGLLFVMLVGSSIDTVIVVLSSLPWAHYALAFSLKQIERINEQGQAPKNNGGKVAPRADSLPATSQRPSGSLSVVALDRPFANRRQSIGEDLQHWLRTTGRDRNAFERWTEQPMTDDPYQNMKSIITNQPNSTENQLPKHVSPPSQTAATTGSG